MKSSRETGRSGAAARWLCSGFGARSQRSAWLAALTTAGAILAQPAPRPEVPTRQLAAVEAAGREVRARLGNRALAEAGLLDVTAAPYHADPTGRRDATAALQAAIRDARDARLICHLPAGRYLVSDTLSGIQGVVEWDHWPHEGFADPWLSTASFEYPCVLRGPAEGGRAVLVLADRAPGFGDSARPKPVLHFWARSFDAKLRDRPQPNINFNQMIIDVDLELGRGNPGAVGIHHQGAEGSVIEDVTIDATGAFAGVQTAPGSGGAIHGVTVRGGRFGLYLRNAERGLKGSQPAPVASGLRLEGQTEYSILYDGRGPLTVVGAEIDGAGIRSDCAPGEYWNGALNLVDVAIRLKAAGPAVASNHSVAAENLYVENAAVAVQIKDEWRLPGQPAGWARIERLAAPAANRAPELAGGQVRPDDLWIDGRKVAAPPGVVAAVAPPDRAGLRQRHAWPRPFPSRESPGAVNVAAAPYHAQGDGRNDDGPALQRAIDGHEIVYLPKGTYAVAQPLRLRARTKLIGTGNIQTVITALPGAPAFADPDAPAPLIETVDDPAAETVLAFVKLLVPVRNPCVYALRWRAGRRSVVRNVYPIREPSHPHGAPLNHPMVRIEGAGGGRWYTQVLLHWWDQGPDYRHLLIDGTREPLAFYMLEPQHGRGTTLVEARDARNLDIFSVKMEGDFGVLTFRDSRNFRLFGLAGNGMPARGYSLVTLENCTDFLLANLHPQFKRLGHWGALGTAHHPAGWFRVIDRPAPGVPEVRIPGTQQFALYQRGRPEGPADRHRARP